MKGHCWSDMTHTVNSGLICLCCCTAGRVSSGKGNPMDGKDLGGLRGPSAPSSNVRRPLGLNLLLSTEDEQMSSLSLFTGEQSHLSSTLPPGSAVRDAKGGRCVKKMGSTLFTGHRVSVRHY